MMERKPTTLGYAVMALLAREPLSGYDLAGKLEARVGFLWQALHSQIYPELQRLSRDGFVGFKTVKQTDRPTKKLYAMTDHGFETLAAWVTSQYQPPPLRDEVTVRAYALWLADPSVAATFFRTEEERHKMRLAEYREQRRQLEEAAPSDLEDPRSAEFATWAMLRRGLGYEEEYAKWCGWLAEKLESAGPRRARKPPRRKAK